MDSSDKFILSMVATLVAGIVAIALTIAAYNMHANAVMESMVKAGAVPQASYCAVNSGIASQCIVLAMKKGG